MRAVGNGSTTVEDWLKEHSCDSLVTNVVLERKVARDTAWANSDGGDEIENTDTCIQKVKKTLAK